MQETMNQDTGTSGVSNSPVDDPTYNLLQALTSKLEAIEAYEMYVEQDEDGVFEELIEDERRHAEKLYSALRGRIGGS
jgi:rubrerythrin